MTSISRISPYVVLAGAFVALLGIVSFADAEQPRSRIRHVATVQPTRIEVDDSSNAIRFFVDGTEVAMIDSLGLAD